MATKRDTKKKLEKERYKAAEDVCWTLILMMAFGGLDLPDIEREWLGERMQKWSDISDEYEALVAKDQSAVAT
jgi:hypothetical protein